MTLYTRVDDDDDDDLCLTCLAAHATRSPTLFLFLTHTHTHTYSFSLTHCSISPSFSVLCPRRPSRTLVPSILLLSPAQTPLKTMLLCFSYFRTHNTNHAHIPSFSLILKLKHGLQRLKRRQVLLQILRRPQMGHRAMQQLVHNPFGQPLHRLDRKSVV